MKHGTLAAAAEVLVVVFILGLLASFRCAEVPRRDPAFFATVIDRVQLPDRHGGVNCFLFIEYRDGAGALVHEQILVSWADYVRYRRALYVCVSRTVSGYRLSDCGY